MRAKGESIDADERLNETEKAAAKDALARAFSDFVDARVEAIEIRVEAIEIRGPVLRNRAAHAGTPSSSQLPGTPTRIVSAMSPGSTPFTFARAA